MKFYFYLVLLTGFMLVGCFEDNAIQPKPNALTDNILAKERGDSPPKVRVVDHDRVQDANVSREADREAVYPCTTESNVFILTYFSPQTNECYTEPDLVDALVNAGEPAADAITRAYTIFHTAFNSPELMGETAGIIGPSEFPLSNGNYSGSYWNMLDEGQCFEGCIPDPLPPGQEYSGCAPGDITRAQHLAGPSGSILYGASNNSWARIGSNCDDSFFELIQFDISSVEALLEPDQWTDLLLGNYNEREFWNLYQYKVIPYLQEYHDVINSDIPHCYVMEGAGFRSNYFSTGQFGYSIYNIYGLGRIYCGPGF